jgi:hypothetical protein
MTISSRRAGGAVRSHALARRIPSARTFVANISAPIAPVASRCARALASPPALAPMTLVVVSMTMARA